MGKIYQILYLRDGKEDVSRIGAKSEGEAIECLRTIAIQLWNTKELRLKKVEVLS
ncbi:MAG: hypothetical protein ACP5QI_04210 [Candidatus Bathyarchaeia archaeon]